MWASSEGLGSVPENPHENCSPPKIVERKTVTAETKKKPKKVILSLADFNLKAQNRSKENIQKGVERYLKR
jgi:hypothetical protein